MLLSALDLVLLNVMQVYRAGDRNIINVFRGALYLWRKAGKAQKSGGKPERGKKFGGKKL